jgi:type IV pilus assembly protein PilP
MKAILTPWVCMLVALGSVACEEEISVATVPAAGSGPRPSAAAPAPGTAPAATAAPGATSAPVYRDSDFVDSDRNRDPFRSFANELKAKMPVTAQRAVIMPNTPVDAMKLIAIISGINQPRAMLVDEKGVGYVTARGDFVGKADVVQGGGSESIPIALNWRVDRIRENEIVLAREDPSAPNRPPLTRVIPLHDKGEPSGDQG